jgi:hypothetical protein
MEYFLSLLLNSQQYEIKLSFYQYFRDGKTEAETDWEISPGLCGLDGQDWNSSLLSEFFLSMMHTLGETKLLFNKCFFVSWDQLQTLWNRSRGVSGSIGWYLTPWILFNPIIIQWGVSNGWEWKVHIWNVWTPDCRIWPKLLSDERPA